MAHDLGEVGDVPQEPDPQRAPSRLQFLVHSEQAWVADGGVGANGTKYAPPGRAIAWGKQGCPLLPREAREQLKGIRLPERLEQHFGTPLTVDQLDAGLLERLDIDELSTSATKAFRDFLYSLPPEADEVAIPAGIPLAWFEHLPLTGRTRAAVQKAFRLELDTESFLSVPILAHQFLSVRSVGSTTLNELACVVESVELERTAEESALKQGPAPSPRAPSAVEAQVNEAALQLVRSMSSFAESLYGFARWAMAETDAQTFGGAVAELSGVPRESEAWDALASVRLSNLAARAPHPYEVLDAWLEGIEPRKRVIFLTRVSVSDTNVPTLEELGARFGVTRERVRQIEVRLRRSFDQFLDTDEALPIRWRASTLRRMLGVAAPESTVEHLLISPAGCNDHRGILLELAGPYDRDDVWVKLRSARAKDPTSSILAQVDEAGRINRDLAYSQLADWGAGCLFPRRMAIARRLSPPVRRPTSALGKFNS